jgi:hypothetical protein
MAGLDHDAEIYNLRILLVKGVWVMI